MKLGRLYRLALITLARLAVLLFLFWVTITLVISIWRSIYEPAK